MTKKIEVQKTEVVSIKLRIKGKEIDLSLEDAKELKDALNKVFAEPVTIKEYVPYYPYIPYEPYKPYEPWISPFWTTTGTIPQKLPEIYCGDVASETASTILGSYFSTGPTTATCDPQGCCTINVGGM